MKMSINEGSTVEGSNVGFAVSVIHCKKLSNFLWDWYGDLVCSVAERIEVITVNPASGDGKGRGVSIKVILGGVYPRYLHGGGGESLLWKNHFVETLYDYTLVHDSLLGDEKDLKEKLDNKLLGALKNEIMTHQELVDKLTQLASLTRSP